MTSNSQVVVITGAGRGLGAGMARQLSAKGYQVALLDRDPEPLARTAAACGPGARGWTADVTDPLALARVADEVVAHFGRVDVVVANAGIGGGGLFVETDADVFEKMIEVNLMGSVRTARAFLPQLLASRGHFLQIASLAAFTPAPLMSAYCASKSGVEAFAHCLRGEVAHLGVTVGVAYLAFTDTDMVREADADPALKQLRASLPWPFCTTAPVEPAVTRLVKGIESRTAHVYAQRWLRVMPLVRGALPGFTARAGLKGAAQAAALVPPQP